MKVILPARVANVCPAALPDTHEVSSKPYPPTILSQRQATQLQGNPSPYIMDINLDFLKPVYELVQNEEVQKKLDETARLYWSPVSFITHTNIDFFHINLRM